MADLYEALDGSGYSDHEASIFLIRTLFCLYGDDAGLWERDLFTDCLLYTSRHVPAAQRAGTLLAHDPGESVDDVGFTRPVGADDARDARLEGERGRTGEGLKAPQRQVLEVHPCRLAATQ